MLRLLKRYLTAASSDKTVLGFSVVFTLIGTAAGTMGLIAPTSAAFVHVAIPVLLVMLFLHGARQLVQVLSIGRHVKGMAVGEDRRTAILLLAGYATMLASTIILMGILIIIEIITL